MQVYANTLDNLQLLIKHFFTDLLSNWNAFESKLKFTPLIPHKIKSIVQMKENNAAN